MTWHILGQGSIGLLWAYHWRINQHKVYLLDRHHQGPSINRSFSIDTYQGATQSFECGICAIDDTIPITHLLVPLKAFDVVIATTSVLNRLSDNAVIVLCHNGMGTIEPVKALLKQNQQLYFATTTHGAYRKSKTQLVHSGLGQTKIGAITNSLGQTTNNSLGQTTNNSLGQTTNNSLGQTTNNSLGQAANNSLGQAANSMGQTKIDVGQTKISDKTGVNPLNQQWVKSIEQGLAPLSWHQDITAILWSKLAINCVINPLTAIEQCKNGQLNQPQYQKIINSLCVEFKAIARACGVEFTLSQLLNQVYQVIEATANNYSSMYQDLQQNKEKTATKTEIDFITGYLITQAEQHQIDVPHMQQIYRQIKQLER